ncbi:EthD family reductase [Microbacterium sp. 5K110]|jgi:uncharacterized protein (TIGR02118 family)|uniref:EthD family reductase n=1 Tax=unclassified Microbacterium TaxID=2609290 RepID=UPI0010FECAE6|nr:EthD family reductase [Microbacterium sp. 5K110]TLF30547.1 EthD family reductase [Microbacterium sp. 5K110]
MHKIVVLYPPPTDRAHFARYYRETHLPLAARLPGAVEMGYALDLDAQGGPYYAMFEATFASPESADAAMASPEGLAVQADVSHYASGGAIVMGVPLVAVRAAAARPPLD